LDDNKDLRRGVDHIGVSASFVVHDGNGRILLQKRSKQCRDEHGTWDCGGGAIEFGESIDQAVRREIMEELCAEPIKIEFLTVYDAHRTHYTSADPLGCCHACRSGRSGQRKNW